jgi:hypothetical protein
MTALHLTGVEFRELAERVTTLAADFLAGLDERPTVSASSATDTAAFDLPLPEEGVGSAVLHDLEAIAEHVARRNSGLTPERTRAGMSLDRLPFALGEDDSVVGDGAGSRRRRTRDD